MINAERRLSRWLESRRHKNAAPHILAITKVCARCSTPGSARRWSRCRTSCG